MVFLNNSPHLARKDASGYLFEDIICPLLGTDNARGQISLNIFAQNRGYSLHIQRVLVDITVTHLFDIDVYFDR